MRAAIYVRLSQETENTTSPARQRELCRAYAESRGWTVVPGVYEDIDVSATKTGLDRPALGRLREAVAGGDVDVVIVWRLDRLARSVLNTLTILKEWTDQGCSTASATESFDLTTPMGKAMVTLIAIFAEMETDAIRARVSGSIDHLRHSKRFAGGTVPYCYVPVDNPNGPGRVLDIDDVEAAVVREAVDLVLDGHSLGRVCRLLNERGVPAPRSEIRRLARAGEPTVGADRGVWRVQSLRRLLTGDHLVGRQTHKGALILGETGMPAQVWPPVISGAVLTQVRDLLAGDGTAPRKPRVRQARMLSGLARCSECGAKMYVSADGGRATYYCTSRRNGVPCPSPRVGAEALEAYVAAEALGVLASRRLTRTVATEAESGASGESTASLAEVQRAIDETLKGMGIPGADRDALLTRLDLLMETRTSIEEARQPDTFYSVTETGETWGEAFTRADTDGRRVLLEADLSAVRVHPMLKRSSIFDPQRVSIVWGREDYTVETEHDDVGVGRLGPASEYGR